LGETKIIGSGTKSAKTGKTENQADPQQQTTQQGQQGLNTHKKKPKTKKKRKWSRNKLCSIESAGY
jgi:hypothetical protein